jgi:hypothetical protein
LLFEWSRPASFLLHQNRSLTQFILQTLFVSGAKILG